MPTAVRTPRINNNDDLVRFSQILSPAGSIVQKGDPVAEIETDKATFTIEAEAEGYVLGFVQPLGEMIPVGSVLAWLGSSLDESMPSARNTGTDTSVRREPTLKAAILLARFRLNASEVPASGERLTVQEVLDFVHSRNLNAQPHIGPVAEEVSPPLARGEDIALTVPQRAMLKSVLWHRQCAVPGYVEIEYDTRAWDMYAKAFQQEHNLLLSPLLPLMAWRLAKLAVENPFLNCTITGDRRHQYSVVNLGFTLQSETKLALLSVRDAGALAAREFVDRLTGLMRRGMRDKLAPEDTADVTISFTSMSRWKVRRHIPVLPPYTSLIVAHAHGTDGTAALGGTYDHRVVTGGEVAVVLHSLAVPPS